MGDPDDVVAAWAAFGLLAGMLILLAEPVSWSFRKSFQWVIASWVVLFGFIGTHDDLTTHFLVGQSDWFALVVAGIAAALLLFTTRTVLNVGMTAIVLWLSIATMLPETSAMIMLSTVMTNLTIFGFALALIWTGIRDKVKTNFMVGLGLVVLHALVRFNDYFDDYLIGALIFILAGIGLVIANLYWNKRYAK